MIPKVYDELPAVLKKLGNNKTLDSASINDAEQLYQKCSELMQKLIYYQSSFQDDFNRLKNGTSGLYSQIQNIKQEEYHLRRDEIINETRWSHKLWVRERRKNIVKTLIAPAILVITIISFDFYWNWTLKGGRFFPSRAPAAVSQSKTADTGNQRMMVTKDNRRLLWKKDLGRYERLSLRSEPGGKTIIAQMERGEEVTVLETGSSEKDSAGFSGNWLKVRYGSLTGWCFSAYLDPVDQPNR